MLYETDASDLIGFAKAWAEMGAVVAKQVTDVVDAPQSEEVNPAAIELAWHPHPGLHPGATS